MNIVSHIVTNAPKFHSGGKANWAVNEDVLRAIQEHAAAGANTLETGCGLSTVLFCALGCNHVCVTPEQDEADRVILYARQIGLATDKLHFSIGSSDVILPGLAQDAALDVVLIDGAHRFPFPALDFHFVEHRMRVGSVLIVDDVQIRAVGMLEEFLEAEAEWQRSALVQHTAFYRKIAEPCRAKDWVGQRLNTVSLPVEPKSLLERAIAKAGRIIRQRS